MSHLAPQILCPPVPTAHHFPSTVILWPSCIYGGCPILGKQMPAPSRVPFGSFSLGWPNPFPPVMAQELLANQSEASFRVLLFPLPSGGSELSWSTSTAPSRPCF